MARGTATDGSRLLSHREAPELPALGATHPLPCRVLLLFRARRKQPPLLRAVSGTAEASSCQAERGQQN